MFYGVNHAQGATPPEPTYGTATVDGDPSEWNLAEDGTGDFFADMYRASKPEKPVESKLYLRYDCKTNILYALVLSIDPDTIPIVVSGDDAFIKYDNPNPPPPQSKVIDGNSATFTWIEQGYDSDQTHAKGWEASGTLDVGSYKINASTNVFDEETQTSAVNDREVDLILNCKPNAIELKSFKGKSGGNLNVELEWETASEIENSGFNLYRARGNKNGKFGKYVKINGDLIPSTGGTTGDHYMYEDQVSKPGNYRYKLEDVANDGTSTRHGPIKVKVRKK